MKFSNHRHHRTSYYPTPVWLFSVMITSVAVTIACIWLVGNTERGRFRWCSWIRARISNGFIIALISLHRKIRDIILESIMSHHLSGESMPPPPPPTTTTTTTITPPPPPPPPPPPSPPPYHPHQQPPPTPPYHHHHQPPPLLPPPPPPTPPPPPPPTTTTTTTTNLPTPTWWIHMRRFL